MFYLVRQIIDLSSVNVGEHVSNYLLFVYITRMNQQTSLHVLTALIPTDKSGEQIVLIYAFPITFWSYLISL
jgi:hypothetical protein